MKHRLLALTSLMMSLMAPLTDSAAPDPTGETLEVPQTSFSDGGVTETIAKANKAIESRLLEGDIAVDRSRNAVPCRFCKWSKYGRYVLVPVYISSHYSSSEKSLIKSALDQIEKQTCVWFYFISRHWTWFFSGYLYIYSGDGCWSYIGRTWSRGQKVSLQKDGCLHTVTIQHEILHALGFAHEHSRSDRDEYIRVLYDNIDPSQTHNFNKYETNNLQTPYDFDSVMQYSNFAFSQNEEPTLESKADPTRIFGFASEVSSNDLLRINRYYSCRGHLRGARAAPEDQVQVPKT